MSWDMIELGKVCEFINGDRSENYPGKLRSKNNGVPFINAGHIVDGKIDHVNMDYIPKEAFEVLRTGVVRENDIVFCLRGSLGKHAIIEKGVTGAIASSLVILRHNQLMDTRFLNFILDSEDFISSLTALNTGSSQPNLSAKSVMKINVPLPSLAEQRHVAAEIEHQLAIVGKAKQAAMEQLAAAQVLNAAYLREVFDGNDWEQVRLGDVCEDIFAGGDVPYNRFSKIKTAEYMTPVYTNGETNDGFFGYTNYARVTKKSVTISGRGTIGYSSVREAGYYPAIRLIAAIPKVSLDANFLHYSLLCYDFRKDGTSIPQLTVPMVKEIEIALPRLDEQQRIVEYLGDHYAKTNKTISALQRQLDMITAIPTAILRRAFSGQM